MKKNNNVFSALLSKITGSKKSDSSKKYQNYTSLVNNFKTKIELD